jgi:hypothetical protein
MVVQGYCGRQPIEDQQLVFDEHGFGDDGTRAARTGESGDGHQHMQEQDDQIVHGPIMLPREIQEMLRIWQFACAGAMSAPNDARPRRRPR